MTQQELKNIIVRLRCCSSNIANCLSKELINGSGLDTIVFNNLLLLNNYISLLLKYNLSDTNCISEQEFIKILNNATGLCEICDCE